MSDVDVDGAEVMLGPLPSSICHITASLRSTEEEEVMTVTREPRQDVHALSD